MTVIEYLLALIQHFNLLTLINLAVCLLNFVLMFIFVKPKNSEVQIEKSIISLAVMLWMALICFRILTFKYDGNVDFGEFGFNATYLYFLIRQNGNVIKSFMKMTTITEKKH